MWWRSWAAPVTIEAAQTGVTEGNAATQSDTYRPRAINLLRTGAAPAATARSSIAGAIASITHSTSLGGDAPTARSAAQDAQPRVLPRRAGARPPQEPAEQDDRQVAERMNQRDQSGEQQRGE